MSTSSARVPCTIVTGFLGAGKTTLIRHVLAYANGRRLAAVSYTHLTLPTNREV